MAIKQKSALFIAIFGIITGLMSAIIVAALATNGAYAQAADPCSTIPSGWTQTLAACEEAVENGEDPCAAIYDTLVADGNDAAEERRTACEGAAGTTGSSNEPQPEETCDPAENTCCDKVKTSIISGDDICGTADEEGGIIFGLLKWVLRIMTAGIGITAVGGIAYGALLYSSAENKPEQTKKAISIITNVVIGILAYALMYVFLNFLIPGGIFL